MKLKPTSPTFTRYQVFMIAILAILQFTIIVDFMVMSPLSAILMPKLRITPNQFSSVVSAYAFSAGIAGFLAAGFADRFDRKKLLLFFYTGFLIGTVLCALANSYYSLLFARIITGLFGGVMGSISMAIVTDLFKLEVRGRVMGFVQMAFGVSQALGIPIGLALTGRFGWHSPFWMIAGFCLVLGIVMVVYMKPVTGHLKLQTGRNPFKQMGITISNPSYLLAFLATTLLATGGFMLMPFGSAFGVNNLGLTWDQITILYTASGACSFILGPLIGYLSDKAGKYATFVGGSILSMIIVAIYTRMGITPLPLVITLNVIMFAGIMSRMASSAALISGIPQPHNRGAFMSINSSVQQISGGIAAKLAGLVIVQTQSGKILHYDTLGNIVVLSMAVGIGMMYFINRQVSRKTTQPVTPSRVRKEQAIAEPFNIE